MPETMFGVCVVVGGGLLTVLLMFYDLPLVESVMGHNFVRVWSLFAERQR